MGEEWSLVLGPFTWSLSFGSAPGMPTELSVGGCLLNKIGSWAGKVVLCVIYLFFIADDWIGHRKGPDN